MSLATLPLPAVGNEDIFSCKARRHLLHELAREKFYTALPANIDKCSEGLIDLLITALRMSGASAAAATVADAARAEQMTGEQLVNEIVELYDELPQDERELPHEELLALSHAQLLHTYLEQLTRSRRFHPHHDFD